jgi:hypothetical protein
VPDNPSSTAPNPTIPTTAKPRRILILAVYPLYALQKIVILSAAKDLLLALLFLLVGDFKSAPEI